MDRFDFGDEVFVHGSEDSLIKLLPPDTKFFVHMFDDPSSGVVPVIARRNGVEKHFWVERHAVYKINAAPSKTEGDSSV